MARKKVLPGGKGTTKKQRKWKADADTVFEITEWKLEADAKIAEMTKELQEELDAKVEALKKSAKVPPSAKTNLIGRYFYEVQEK